VIVLFLVKFPVCSSCNGVNDEQTSSSKFLAYTLLGVVVLTFETLLAGIYLVPENLAVYGVLQRVYLSVILITSVVNQINWSKYTESYALSSTVASVRLLKSLLFQVFVVSLFLILAVYFRSYWMIFFHIDTVLALSIHVFFMVAVLIRVILEGIATFYLATNRILLMLFVVGGQFIFVAVSILYFGESLNLLYLSAVQMCSFLLAILLVIIFSKTRLCKVYG